MNKIIIAIASWITKLRYGKVISHMNLIYSKKISLLFLADKINKYEEKKIKLPADLILLIKAYSSILNGCSFCEDLALAQAIRSKMGEQKFTSLANWENSKDTVYSPAERSIFRLIKEYAEKKEVSPETMKTLHQFFNEEQVVDIVTMNAIENFYNALSIPFGIKSDGLAEIARKSIS
jgi:alkylhydroperoxidase family enzyme